MLKLTRRHHPAGLIKFRLPAFEQLEIAHIAHGLSRQIIRTLPILGVTFVQYGEGGQIGMINAVKIFICNARSLLCLHDDRLAIRPPSLRKHAKAVRMGDGQRCAILLV
ncbi:hypothetical protein D9M68_979730 [compost metagenome]